MSRDAIRNHPEWGPRQWAAREEYLESLRSGLDAIARGEVEDPQQARVMLAAITWALERADRETYGPHSKTDVHVTGTDDTTASKLAAAIAAIKR